MWREDWAAGRIATTARSSMTGMWIFAAFWNAISVPMLLYLPQEIAASRNRLVWIALIFPIVGVGLLVAAVRSTVRWRKFGESLFEMPSVPGVVGGAVAGRIRFNKPLQIPVDFQLQEGEGNHRGQFH